eukprot:c28435_g1_i1 orf=1992-3461(+)
MGSSSCPSSGFSKPHAVLVPYPAQGHITPMMQLAKLLARKGFCVSFVNSEHNHLRIVQAQAEAGTALPSENGLDIRLFAVPDGLPPECNRMADLARLGKAMEANMVKPLEELMEKLNRGEVPVSCVISDVLLLFTQDLANKFGLPRVAVWSQSVASFAVNLHVPLLIQEGYIPFKAKPNVGPEGHRQSLITCIPGHPPFPPTDMNSFFQVEDLSDFMFQFKVRPFERLKEATLVLINSFYELEIAVTDALQQHLTVLPIGPLLPLSFLAVGDSFDERTGAALWPEDNDCVQWLDKQMPSSVLYISFGSIALLSATQFKELAMGLQASQKPLLWAIRPDLMESIVAALPPGFRDDNNGNIYITDWAPQHLVLSHASVGGFLTHCGWNSTLESISMGVPMLGWPYFADQMLNRKWVVDEWKVGMQFEPGEDGVVSRDEVERLVRLIMDGEEGKEMRESVGKLRDAAKQAVRKGGSSFMNLQILIQRVLNVV